MARDVVALAESTIAYGVSWESYQALLEANAGNSAPRFSYAEGVLRSMHPNAKHEVRNVRLAFLVTTAAEIWTTDVEDFGSTTMRRKDLQRGVDPDRCFYVHSFNQILDQDSIEIDRGDPPPDLVIEIEEAEADPEKLCTFALFRVPELWVVSLDGNIRIFGLSGEVYLERTESMAFPKITSTALKELMDFGANVTLTYFIKRVREWAFTA